MISLKIDDLNWSKQNGLIPVVVQDNLSKDILMVAYANKEALEKTCTTRLAHFWSRSKQKLWLKGETSESYHIQLSISSTEGDDVLPENFPFNPNP